jgi:tRNA threonylcarbamoyladenosine biosynthesis protein TsaE
MIIRREITSAEGMTNLGLALAQAITTGTCIHLRGELGAGKTTFVRGFLRGLGYEGKVKSPTYTLVEPYDLLERSVFHFDLYRLNDPAELTFIGIQDYFEPEAVCLIEWPEKGNPLLPAPDLTCYIEFIAAGRLVTLQAQTPIGEQLLHEME